MIYSEQLLVLKPIITKFLKFELNSLFEKKSQFQDGRLKQLVEEYNEKWDIISEHFPDRSDVQCQQRWTKVVNPELVKGPWTKEVKRVIEQ